MNDLQTIHLDRAAGAIIGLAAGDALGAGYEFGPPLADGATVSMTGGGRFGWAPGEWTDDTSMAIPLVRALADGASLDDTTTLDGVVAAWADWARSAKDVGIQTQRVLSGLESPTASAAVASARAVHDRSGRSGGNGSLMRTAPVALGYLGEGAENALAVAARSVSSLTHWEEDAGDACVLWCLAIRHAILTGMLDVRVGLPFLPHERRELWLDRLAIAERSQPRDFTKNGWVVEALQGAWSAIHHSNGFVDALERAVRGGNDTDTVAAIAGSLVGAATGVSGIPARWRRILHGWPGLRVRDLMSLAVLAARGGVADSAGWPRDPHISPTSFDQLVRHPHDDGVWLASLAGLRRLPPEVDAVVSLCRVGAAETELETIEFWLIDRTGANTHLTFVLEDAADTIAQLRAEGKVVAVHCMEGRSRTPAVAAVYSVRHRAVEAQKALDDVLAVLPHDLLSAEFTEVVMRDIRPFSPATP